MPYFNRKIQLLTTLKTINLTNYPYNDFETIIIDDGSDADQRIEDLVGKFDFGINLIRVNKEEKVWQEPLPLINKVVRECSSEIIILQNSECCHAGDVISYAVENSDKNKYLSFGSFNVSGKIAPKIWDLEIPSKEKILNIIGNFLISPTQWAGEAWWYNHSVHRPAGYYFCSSMLREDYIEIGGLNEEFAYGVNFCDDEFMRRIRNKKKLVFVDDPFTVHLYHPSHLYMRDQSFANRNRRIYDEIVSGKTNIDDPILSILICSVIDRKALLDLLLAILNPQIKDRNNIELLILSDNAEKSIGQKRNDALAVAKGQYVCFIDDDDTVSTNYVDLILEQIHMSRPDAIVFDVEQTTNGQNPKLMKFGKEYEHSEKNGIYYRLPNHLMVFKKSIITERFPDLKFGEDWEWASRMKKKINSQSRINKVLYYYDYNPSLKRYFDRKDIEYSYKLFDEYRKMEV